MQAGTLICLNFKLKHVIFRGPVSQLRFACAPPCLTENVRFPNGSKCQNIKIHLSKYENLIAGKPILALLKTSYFQALSGSKCQSSNMRPKLKYAFRETSLLCSKRHISRPCPVQNVSRGEK